MSVTNSNFSQQRGATLLVTMCVLMLLMIIGMSAVRVAVSAERAARGDRDRQIALQGAEAALEDAEHDIEGGSNPASARAALFASGSSEGFAEGCGAAASDPAVGLCLRLPEPAAPAWQRAALANDAAGTVQYGPFTGARMPVGKGSLPSKLPRYIIELMPYARAGHDASARTGNFYRITAIGFGANVGTCVVLQSYYLKAGEAA
jgi:type IV pilus assembly protein PilX